MRTTAGLKETSPGEEKSYVALDDSPISSRVKEKERLGVLYLPLLHEELGPADRRYRKGRPELV